MLLLLLLLFENKKKKKKKRLGILGQMTTKNLKVQYYWSKIYRPHHMTSLTGLGLLRSLIHTLPPKCVCVRYQHSSTTTLGSALFPSFTSFNPPSRWIFSCWCQTEQDVHLRSSCMLLFALAGFFSHFFPGLLHVRRWPRWLAFRE